MKQGHEYTVQELLAFINEHEQTLTSDKGCSEMETRILTTSLALCTAELVKRLYTKEQS